jgi:hypothetical protein
MTAQSTTLLLLGSLVLAAACGKSNPKSPGLDEMGSPGIAWSGKSYQQRLDFMAGVFHPKTKKLFTDFKDRYGKADAVTCETCHGESARELQDAHELAVCAAQREHAAIVARVRRRDDEIHAGQADACGASDVQYWGRRQDPSQLLQLSPG